MDGGKEMSGISFGSKNTYKIEAVESEPERRILTYECPTCDGGNRVPLSQRDCFWCGYLNFKENDKGESNG